MQALLQLPKPDAYQHKTAGAALTFTQLSASLQCSVNGHSGVQNPGSLPVALLPGHMVGQLAQAVGYAPQIYSAIAFPGPPCSSSVVTPGPQSICMCLQRKPLP